MRSSSSVEDSRVARRLRALTGAYAVLGGLVSLAGWVLDLPRLSAWQPGGIAMQPNSALASALAGTAVLLWSRRSVRSGAILGLGAVVALLGGTTLAEHLTGADFGIDRLLLFGRSWGSAATVVPGRIGPPASISFLLIGIALSLAATIPSVASRTRSSRLVPVLGLGVSVLALFSILGYVLRAEPLYSIAPLTGIAFQTATILLALGVGVIATAPDRQPMLRVAESSGTGELARRLLPVLIFLPPVIGWLRIQSEALNALDAGTSRALFSLALILTTTAIFWSALGVLKRQELAEQASSRQVVDTLESLTDSFFRVDPFWRFVYLNQKAIDRLGGGDRLGKSFWNEIPEATAAAGAALHRAMTERVSVEYELFSQREQRWFRDRVYPTADGGLAIYSLEVTEQKRSEIALRAKEAELEKIAANTPIFLTRLSRDLRYVFANQAYADFLGRPRAEIVGATIESIIGAEAFAELCPHFERVLAGEPVEYEAEIHFAGIGAKHLNARYVPDVDDEGNVRGWFASIQDITDRKQAELALRDADRRKDEFLATLSHELRNPLAPVRNAVQILRHDQQGPTDIRWALDVIDRQTRQMTRLVDDLFDVSRISQGKFELRRERIELRGVVEHAIEATRPAIDRGSHELFVKLPSESVLLDADPIRLTQIFSNLLSNAAKFSELGGRIDLAAERRGELVEVTVRDAGIGISSELLPNVFEMFVQGDRSLERSRGGLGIGLTLVRQLVELHGGSVEARSDGLGKGSAFLVRLPVAAPAALPAPARSDPARPASRRVLVVDDNRDGADSLATMLKLLGNDVEVAYDGAEGLASAERFRPQIVLLDIGLPGRNGYEVARELRARPELGIVVLVAVTGWGQEEDRRRSREAGFDFHMTKPIDPDFLRRLLASPTGVLASASTESGSAGS